MVKKGKNNNDGKQAKKLKRPTAPKVTSQVKTSRKPSPEKKPAAGKTPVAVKSREPIKTKTTLTPKELAHFQHLLLAKRGELVGDVNSMEDEALQKSKLSASGDLSTMPIHMADIGTANYEQEFALGLLDGERKLLREINEALQRIEDRTYGICEGTGREISKARLEANPWARYCVEYARMVEQGLVKEGDVYVDKDHADEEEEDIMDEEDVIEGEEEAADDAPEEAETPEEEPLPDDEEELDEGELDWREGKD